MEVAETEKKDIDQLNANDSSSDNVEVSESEKECDQLSSDDLSCVDHLGLISQQEYEAQFFGFTPKSFSDGCK